MQYVRRPGDLRYRRIPMTTSDLSAYTDFTMDSQRVTCGEAVVLEIQRDDGTVVAIYNEEKRPVSIRRSGNQYLLPANLPLARLWLRDKNGIDYKIPANLPVEPNAVPAGSQVYFTVDSRDADAVIVGDPYFNKVYEIG